jgi:pyruvate kinase
MRKTKILCTLGPATESAEVIANLIAKGADLIRLNMSHASHEWTRAVYANVREASERADKDVAVLMDLTGPSIRTGDLEAPWQLNPGDQVELRTKAELPPTLSYSVDVNYPELCLDLKPGNLINIDGGLIQLKVLRVGDRRIIGEVLTRGEMRSRRHINLPGVPVRLPPLTGKDYKDLDLGVELGVDFVALSFAREPGHIQHCATASRAKKKQRAGHSQDRKPAGTRQLDTIVEASGGIMIARGDLGSEVPIEDLPIIQRDIIERCSYPRTKGHRGHPDARKHD